MAYTLHNEMADGTLDSAFSTIRTKAEAVRVAKVIAKQPSFDAVRLIVQDANEMTVVAIKLPEWVG